MTPDLLRYQVEALTRDCTGRGWGGVGAGGCQRDLKSADGAESTTTTQMCRYSRTETKGK